MASGTEIGGLFLKMGIDSSGLDAGLKESTRNVEKFHSTLSKNAKAGIADLQAFHTTLDKGTRAAVQNFSFQINDVVGGLLQGQSPFRILVQQGGQFIQAFQSGGGVMPVLRGFASTLRGLVTPATVAVGGLAAVVGGAIALALHTKEVESRIRLADAALRGMGTSSFATGEGLEASVKQLKAMGIAADDARKSVDKVIRTPGINPGSAGKLTSIGADLGTTRGTGTVAGTEEFINTIKGGPDALIRLGLELRKIEPEEVKHILRLKEEKGATAAAEAAIALFGSRISGVHKSTITPFGEALQQLSTKWDNLVETLGKSLVIKSLGDELMGIVDGAKGLVDEIDKTVTNIGRAITYGKSAVNSGINAVTNAGDSATERARKNKLDMDINLSMRDISDGGTGDPRGIRRFDTSAIELNTAELKRLSDVLGIASQSLPEGYSLRATSGKRSGKGGSLHNSGQAIDVEIIDPNDKALPNKGQFSADPGLYKSLAIAARDANNQLYPGTNLTWGQRFETKPGSGLSDWMHFDGGPDRGRYGVPIASLTRSDTAASGPYASGLAAGGGVLSPTSNIDLIIKRGIALEKDTAIRRKWGEEQVRAQAYEAGLRVADAQGIKDEEAKTFATQEATAAVEQHRIELQKASEVEKLKTAAALKSATAYGVNVVAGLKAAATAEAELAVKQGTATDVQSKAQELLASQSAAAINQSAAALPTLAQEVKASEAIAAALKESEAAGISAEIQARINTATQDLMNKAMASGSKEAIEMANALKEQTGALIRRGATADLSKRFTGQNIEDKKTIEQVQLESTLQFETTGEINRQVALLKVKQEVQAAGNNLSEAEVQSRLNTVNALADANKQLERQRQIIDNLKEYGSALESSFSSIFDSVADGTFKIGKAINSIVKDLAKTLASQGFKALLNGESAGGTGSGLFGLLGSAFGFGGKSSGSTVYDTGKGYVDSVGFASGGSFQVGGAGSIDSKVIQFRATPGEMVHVQRPGNSGGSGEVIRLELNHSDAFVSGIADQRIRTHSGTIVDVAVKRSRSDTRRNIDSYGSEATARRG